MKTRPVTYLVIALALGVGPSLKADQPAKVTEAVNVVDHGPSESSVTTPASVGTSVHDGEYLKTGPKSRAEMLLPTASITRLGANTIYNYSVESNTVDLEAGTILFCKPKNASQLNVKTAEVTAGITGTTGFVSVRSDNGHKTYIFGLVEGHATARANGQAFPLGPGDILEFRPGGRPFVFAFDLPRFVKSSPLLTRFKSRLPNQAAIDAALASYQDDVRRGFIQPPSHAIDYSGEIPVVLTAAYDSALNAQGQPKGNASPPPPPPQTPPSFNNSR